MFSGCETLFPDIRNANRNLETIRVPDDFDWSLNTTVDLTVKLEKVGRSLGTIEYRRLFLLDSSLNILAQAIIENQEAHIYHPIPASQGKMIVYLPETGNYQEIYSWAGWGELTMQYGWQDPDEDLGLQYLAVPFTDGIFGQKPGFKSLKSTVFANSGFSTNELVSANSDSYTANLNTDGKWYYTVGDKAPISIEDYEGNSALKVGQQDRKKVELFQTVNWNQQGEFTVQLDAISPSETKIHLHIYLLCYDAQGTLQIMTDKHFEQKDGRGSVAPVGWKTIQSSIIIDRDDIAYLKLCIKDDSGTPVFIDNIITNHGPQWDNDEDGIINGEDAYPEDPLRAFNDYHPSADAYSTLAFEDLWPAKGDYDFNDLVIDYQFNQVRNNENKIIEVIGILKLQAIGGSYQNGFGFELPFSQSLVNQVTGYEHNEGIVTMRANGTESGSDNAIIIVFENAWNYLSIPGVSFVNTRSDEEQVDPYIFNINIQFTRGITDEEIGSPPYNPFIFTNGTRDVEVHLFGGAPTELADMSMFQSGDDFSDIDNDLYYKSALNLPWAMDIPATFAYPEEKSPVDSAYVYFIEWAESSGDSKSDWHLDKTNYRRDQKIFKRK